MLTKNSLCTAWSVAGLLLVSACGGGGGGGSAADPSVSTMSAPASAKYSNTLLITLTGTNLDSAGLAVASPGCKNMTRSTIAPNVSDASTAYYTCTVSATGAQIVTASRSSDGAVLTTANFSVAVPMVTMAVSNNAGTFNGTIEFTLAPDKAPVTVDNFLRYVNENFYTSKVFHRVARTNANNTLSSWAIQAAGARLAGSPLGTVYPAIPLEVNKGLSNALGTLAMARQTDPNTATYEFFINVTDNQSFLDPNSLTAGYAVFGSVSSGMSVATTIAGAPCAALTGYTAAPDCTPNPLMVITSAVQTQ